MRVVKYLIAIVYVCCLSLVYSNNDPDEYDTLQERVLAEEAGELEPWLTGPLLAPAGHTIPAGHTNWEPYVFFTYNQGIYDHHWKKRSIGKALSINPTIYITQGLTDWMDFQINPQFFYNKVHTHEDFRFGDLPLQFGFQALNDKKNSWIPDLRITLTEVFPTGHYQHFDPDDEGVDATGLGSYQSKLAFNFQKLFAFGLRLFRVRLNLSYGYSASVHVEGFNAYGGGFGARGKIHPGNLYSGILAFEYTFNQNWVGAIDFSFSTNNSSSFKGFPGIRRDGTLSEVVMPASSLFSIAPAIEYNFNANVGIILGLWFTAAGRNAPDFISGVIALNYYH